MFRIIITFIFVAISIISYSQEPILDSVINNKIEETELLFQENKYNLVINNYQELIPILIENEKNDYLISVYIYIGRTYGTILSYKEAIKYYQLAEKIAKDNNDIENLVIVNNTIGNVYLMIEDFKVALKYYKKSLEYAKITKEKRLISYTYIGIGNAYNELHNTKESVKYYNYALKQYTEVNDTSGIIIILYSLANMYFIEGNTQNSLNLLFEADNYVKADNPYAYAKIYNLIADVYVKQGTIDSALIYSEKSNYYAIKANEILLQRDNAFIQQHFYEQKNNFGKAYSKAMLCKQLNDSIDLDVKIKDIYNYNLQNDRIKYDNELLIKEKEIAFGKIKFVFALILGALFLIFGIVFFIQKNQESKANKILVKQNIEITESEKLLAELNINLEAHIVKKKTKNIKNKYTSSQLTDSKKEELVSKLVILFEEEQIYTNSDLTLNKLAKQLDVSRSYLSQTINEKYDKNFNNYINDFRIKYARQLLLSDESKSFTIEAIANKVGFNSTPSFNSAFKKYTGVTPSYFIKTSKVI